MGPPTRFASIVREGRPQAVAVSEDRVIPLKGVAELGAATPLEVLRDPPLDHRGGLPLTDVTLRPVVPRPAKVVCVGHNYRAHVAETRRRVPQYPVLFAKFASSLIGPFDPIVAPPESGGLDYEGELAVVIGRRARRVPIARALEVIAGYTVANDVSMRDYQYKTHQWLQGKAWDDSTPLGPHLVLGDELDDPGALRLRVTLNGDEVQAATTDLLIFDVATLVSCVSEFTVLEPGDVLLTGTPAGVGVRRDPPVFLQDGDVVAVEIDAVGRIENLVRTEPPDALSLDW